MVTRAGYSQQADSASQEITENGYIGKMDSFLALKLSVSNDIEGFEVMSNGPLISIRPNTRMASHLSFNYRFLSLSVSFAPRFLPGNGDDDLKGKTQSMGYSMNLSFRHWLQGLSLSHVKGYYLDNTDAYITGWVKGTDPYIQFPDLVYNGFNGITGYKFNARFSTRSLSSQTERQLRSSGSFIPYLSYRYYIIDNREKLTGQNSTQKSDNLEWLIMPGYFYTFILKKSFYTSLGLVPGIGMIHTWLLTRSAGGDFNDHQSNTVYRLEAHAAAGYHSTRLFAGGRITASWASFRQEGTTAVTVDNRITYQLYAGYRFNAPKIVRKGTDLLEEKIPVL
ncbi:MAG: DUF4421 family protein [Bacteroidales bacterium]|nr:DUF4421 family protein [Bacteroidales bacterium]